MQGALHQPTCELPSPSGGLLLANKLSLDFCWVPFWANPSDAPLRFYSVNKWRTTLPDFSRQLCITPEALPDTQVEVDRLLDPLSKGARAALQRLREKQEIPSVTVIESTERAKETKIAFDNQNAPMPVQELSKDVTRKDPFQGS